MTVVDVLVEAAFLAGRLLNVHDVDVLHLPLHTSATRLDRSSDASGSGLHALASTVASIGHLPSTGIMLPPASRSYADVKHKPIARFAERAAEVVDSDKRRL